MRGFIAAALLLVVSAFGGGPVGAAGELQRIAGPSRVATAVALSQGAHTTADVVVLARADSYADALAGAPLAAVSRGPVLLTSAATLSEEAGSEIDRLGATTVYLLGGESALSRQIETQLRARGVEDVVRLSGPSRFHTAAAVAARIEATAAYLVQGNSADPSRGWPDAVAVSALASFQGRPILLTERDALPEVIAKSLEELGITEVGIIGGTGAVSTAVEQAVRARVVSVYRIAGSSRYATARMVGNQSLNAGMSAARTWLATGRNYPDALAAGPAVAADGGVLLLVDGQSVHDSPDTLAWLDTFRDSFTRVRLVGGTAAISAGVAQDVRRVMDGLGPAPPPQSDPSPEPTQPADPGDGGDDCDPAYPTVCIPSPPPDLDCPDVGHRNFAVRAPDPHGFDRDRDGIGCET